MLADPLLHFYGHIGAAAADARKALERVVELNPAMVWAWEHLVWLGSSQRDTAMMAPRTRRARALGGRSDDQPARRI
jgi:hypothetical protein